MHAIPSQPNTDIDEVLPPDDLIVVLLEIVTVAFVSLVGIVLFLWIR